MGLRLCPLMLTGNIMVSKLFWLKIFFGTKDWFQWKTVFSNGREREWGKRGWRVGGGGGGGGLRDNVRSGEPHTGLPLTTCCAARFLTATASTGPCLGTRALV